MNPGVMMGSHEGTKMRRGEEGGRRLKYVCRLGYGDSLPKDDESSGDIPVFGSNGQYSTTAVRNTSVPAIVLGRKGSYGKVNWAPEGCFASDTTFYIDSNQSASNLRWLYWALQTLKLDEGSQEAAVPGLNRESVYEQRVQYPDNETQRLIADYLDRETARIDALVAEKEKMLDLLEEKRAALISRAVTHGLDPNVSLKPSGFDWLGDIPVHWVLSRLKFIVESLNQGSSPVAANTAAGLGELGILKLSAVNKGRFKREENKALRDSDESEQILSLRKGDVLITRGNTPELVADVAYVPKDEPDLLLPDLIYRIRICEDKVTPQFLTYFFTTQRARVQIQRDARGSSGSMVKVSQGHVLDWQTPVPPLTEQIEIVGKIQAAENKSNALHNELIESISLLKERRAALITAAVTGQIPEEEMIS